MASSFPPFLQLYRAIYRFLIGLAVRRLARFPGTRAVYLTRGWASDEAVPGVSDIDLTVIGDWDSRQQQRLVDSYRQLARIFPLYDRTVETHTLETFQKRYQADHYFQYRFAEGQRTWELLYGQDYLGQLEPLSRRDAFGGYHMEIRVWWSYFARWALQASRLDADKIFQNSLCYKIVGEILKLDAALAGETAIYSRQQAIEEAGNRLGGERAAFLHRLGASAARRHLRYQGAIFDDTLRFLAPYLEELYCRLESHPALEAAWSAPPRVDAAPQEWFRSQPEEAHVQELLRHVRKAWGSAYRAAYLVASVSFAMDELVLMLEIEPDRPPSLEQLRTLNRLHREAQPRLRRRVNLFLLLPSLACQIDLVDLRRSWQTILVPRCNPDVFAMLSQPECCLEGARPRPLAAPPWTQPVQDFIDQERVLAREALDEPAIYKANNLDFLRLFWKCLQLAVIRRSADAGQILYPATLPAVTRALEASGIPLPPFVLALAEAYHKELEGSPTDIGRFLPPAVSYLKHIAHEQ